LAALTFSGPGHLVTVLDLSPKYFGGTYGRSSI
jgi:hypothetical protein